MCMHVTRLAYQHACVMQYVAFRCMHFVLTDTDVLRSHLETVQSILTYPLLPKLTPTLFI